MTSTKLCTVANCGKVRAARGMCQMHYRRVMVHGDSGVNLNAPQDVSKRFFAKVEKTSSCWLWFGASDKHGYGRFLTGSRADGTRKLTLSHRHSWEAVNGAIPDGLNVLHRCDVPACVNPDHLFLGSQKDNVDDMVAKSRHSHGEANGRSILKEETVRQIKLSLKAGETNKSLSARHNVSHSLISMIESGKRWSHV